MFAAEKLNFQLKKELLQGAPAASFMSANKSVQNLNATYEPLSRDAFHGPPAELEKLGLGPGHSSNYKVWYSGRDSGSQ